MPEAPPLIEIEGLKTYFHTEAEVVRAVDDLSVRIPEGHTLGLVGESGSGKSVTSLSVMRLLPEVSARIEAGRISFLGTDLVRLPTDEMRKIRGADISMIFQEPGTSLNPVYRVGSQVMEAIMLHQDVSKAEARRRTIELFREVGIPEPERTPSGYRDYDPAVVDRIVFIRSGQSVGLTLRELGDVLQIRDRGQSPCSHVSDLIDNRIRYIDQRILWIPSHEPLTFPTKVQFVADTPGSEPVQTAIAPPVPELPPVCQKLLGAMSIGNREPFSTWPELTESGPSFWAVTA
jgi:hypothetical protein